MNWHYALLGERRGPVDEEELRRLATAGIVAADTPVWREGMAEWRPYAETFGLSVPVNTPPRICSQCSQPFPEDQVILLDNTWVCAACKPVAMQKMWEGVALSFDAAAEQTRRAHLSHEASVRSVGGLYLLGAVLVSLLLLGITITPVVRIGLGELVIMLTCVVLGGVAGWGVLRWKFWARFLAGVVALFGLLAFPVGTLINGYILYLLFSKKGATVFSAEYQRIIAQTPHVKHRTSVVAWVALGLILAIALVLVFVGISSP